MILVSRHLILPLMLALCSCKATTQLPVTTDEITVRVGVDELVCHVRGLSAEQNLSFHYGTFTGNGGGQATFRLIGDLFEITMVRWNSRPVYELHAYDTSKDARARQQAARGLEHFKAALLERLGQECAS